MDVVKEHAHDKITNRLEEYRRELNEQLKFVNAQQNTETIIEAVQKLKALEEEIRRLAEQNPSRADVADLLKEIQGHRQGMAANILGL